MSEDHSEYHNGTDSRSAEASPSLSTTSLAVSGGGSSVTSSVLELRQAFSSLNERAARLMAESAGTSSGDASLQPSRPRRPALMSRSTSLSSLQTFSSSSTSRQLRFPIDSEGYTHRDALALRRRMSELRINLNRSLNQSQRRRFQRHRRLQADQAISTATSENDENDEWNGRVGQSVNLARVPTRGNSLSDCSQCSSDTKEDDSQKMVTPSQQELDGWLYSLGV